MGSTTYQPQYQGFLARQEPQYTGSTSSYRSSINSTAATYDHLSRPASTASYRDTAPPVSVYHPEPHSPHLPVRSTHDVVPYGEKSPQNMSPKSDLITPNLQIPSSINNSGGSLAEFAAQITCLFWFEPTDTLAKAEAGASPVSRLKDTALPTSGFRKWVVTILSTTQVTQNVILLALLFIYRLKTINPVVKGRSGSEYRLLTVALMLGNKFLDDNTYTNKTWAEVSGISVTEIHVMEVEFLSNMRYSLLASAEQWKEWHVKLGQFWTYCDLAAKLPITLPSPVSASSSHATLPSPIRPMQASPPSLGSMYASPQPHYNQQYHGAPVNSPLPSVPHHDLRPRKRSYIDEVLEEPAAKRVTRSSAHAVPTMYPAPNASMRRDVPRLPVPNLTISTNHNGYNGSTFSQNPPVLPPLNARLSTYPSTPTWTPSLPSLTPTGPQSHHSQGSHYGTPTRRQSPHSVQELLNLGSSPISGNFPGHNPGHNSPSIFLQQRNSPYKPIRHVNTLLYPPPSASMQNFSVNADQMHYQPLGKRNDYRPGVVPDYHQTHHVPYSQQWPVLPQPNFTA